MCSACGQELFVVVTYKSKYKKPSYCRSFAEATRKSGVDVIKLLKDQETSLNHFNGTDLSIDLNGFRLTSADTAILTLQNQTIRFINTGEWRGYYAGTILVGDRSSMATLQVLPQNNDLTFDELIFRYRSSRLSGGTYGKIKVENDITLQKSQGKGFTGAWMFLLPFGDVSEQSHEAVAWCYMNGITKGTSAATFLPNETCTRARLVTFLYRMAQVME